MTVVAATALTKADQTVTDAAALLAMRLGETLRLVHVSEDPRAAVMLGTDEELRLLGRALLGSVTLSVVERARVPVLLVPVLAD